MRPTKVERKKGAAACRFRRHPDSNRGIGVLQTRALPLGYDALYFALKKQPHTDIICTDEKNMQLICRFHCNYYIMTDLKMQPLFKTWQANQ